MLLETSGTRHVHRSMLQNHLYLRPPKKRKCQKNCESLSWLKTKKQVQLVPQVQVLEYIRSSMQPLTKYFKRDLLARPRTRSKVQKNQFLLNPVLTRGQLKILSYGMQKQVIKARVQEYVGNFVFILVQPSFYDMSLQ